MNGYGGHDRARWVPEDPSTKRAPRDDFARDRARVLHSAGLRRLAAKTQVVQPDSDDFVRNRLTHSLEVAQIGRELGAALGCDPDVVDTACLAHDLGHPPFGHHGESVLAAAADGIGGFEGNAQTLRLLTRLEAKHFHGDGRSAGLNLTRASLDAATKYPWVAGGGPEPDSPKFGAYADDESALAWVREGVDGRGRSIEAQVMDWADDVAYSVHDVEDAVAGGRLDLRVLRSPTDLEPVLAVARELYLPEASPADLEAAVERLLASGPMPEGFDGGRRALAALKEMTSRLVGRFVVAAREATEERHGPGPHRRHAADLVVPATTRAESVVLKALAAHYVMHAPSRRDILQAERVILEELLVAFAADPPRRLDPPQLADFAAAADDAGRLRVVIDQVASLSDVRARALHTRWCRGGPRGPLHP